MPEQTPRTLNHFGLFKFSQRYFQLPKSQKKSIQEHLISGLKSTTQNYDLYQLYPTEPHADILIWSAVTAEDPAGAHKFFTDYAQVTNQIRAYLSPAKMLWGFTKPSQYTKARSKQEIDPFEENRKSYLVMYPFTKTEDWYLMSRDARQGMMNEHIRIGKQYPEIAQLLLYSFGLQDHEFVVVYETDDLTQFSDLVYELRDTEARRYTKSDSPLHTAIYHSPAETLALFSQHLEELT